jgi:hypothetical protein
MFQTKVVQKIKTHILCSVTFFPKVVPLWDNVEKYGTARKATDGNIIWRIHFACWINKATDTHSESVTLIPFPRKQSLRERASSLPLYVRCMSCWALFWCKKRCYGQMGHICKFNIRIATHACTHAHTGARVPSRPNSSVCTPTVRHKARIIRLTHSLLHNHNCLIKLLWQVISVFVVLWSIINHVDIYKRHL